MFEDPAGGIAAQRRGYQRRGSILDAVIDEASGLEKQLITVCKREKLRKISLKPGRWYDGDKARDRKFDF